MADGVGGAVEAGGLAVPQADDAVVAGPRVGLHELAPLDGGGRQLLVEPRPVDDVVLVEEVPAALQLEVEAGQGRARVARDERGRVQAGPAVGPVLVEGQADEGLEAGEEDPALFQQVLVVEAEDGGGAHTGGA